MLHRFTARRYRNVDVEDLELGRLNVLVGPNNAGKSNFIRAIRFLHHLLFPRDPGNAFLSAVETRGRGDLLDRNVPAPADIDLAWTLTPTPTAGALTYELSFRIGKERFPDGFYVTKERLLGNEDSSCFFERRAASPATLDFIVEDKTLTWKVSPQETTLVSLPGGQSVDAVRDLRSYFADFHAYHSGQIDPCAVAQGVRRDVLTKSLDPSGLQLANVLRHLEQNEGLDAYTRLLGQVIPDLRRVNTYDAGDEFVSVRLHIGDGRPFKLSEMSDGTIKAMILALLVSTSVHTKLLCIDEPELNLHPAWLHIMGKWFVDCRSADQLIVSTHSPEILDALTPAFREGKATLFIFNDKPHGGVHRVEPGKLDIFFSEGWELGDLYRVGEPKLGGWPW